MIKLHNFYYFVVSVLSNFGYAFTSIPAVWTTMQEANTSMMHTSEYIDMVCDSGYPEWINPTNPMVGPNHE